MNKLLDLFAGCGGLSLGLKCSQIFPTWANESNSDAAKTYALNHPGAQIFQYDAKNLLSEVLKGNVKGLEQGKVDIISGGPPCQGFCEINRFRKIDDPRNSCVELFFRFVEYLKPKVILMENVTGILTLSNGVAITSLIESLNSIGYTTKLYIIQCGSFGLPQNRWRVFLLGHENGKQINFPNPTHLFHKTVFSGMNKWKKNIVSSSFSNENLFSDSLAVTTTVEDAIGDLPYDPETNVDSKSYYTKPASSIYQQVLRNTQLDYTYDHATNKVERITLERFRHIPPGGGWQDLPYDLQPKNLKSYDSTSFASRYGRLKWSNTFTAIVTKPEPYWGRFIHPENDRLLTVRECARAQGFPDSFIFSGSISSRYKQIGNAVPPIVSRLIGEKISEAIKC